MNEPARRRAIVAVGVAAAAGLSSWAALTVPFSTGADTVTALGLGLVGVEVVGAEVAARWRRPALTQAGGPLGGDGVARPRWWPWVVLGVAVLTWELVCLFLGPRVDHPTVSSLYDSATRSQAVKGACFFAWLCLGAALVRS
jgi:hypothetical protein